MRQSVNHLISIHKSRLFLTLSEAVDIWLTTLSPLTRKNYASGIRFLSAHNILMLSMPIGDMVNVDHSDVLYKIKSLKYSLSGRLVSEASKQARAACYISLTKFLYRLTKGSITPAVPSRDFGSATFYKIRDKVKTAFLSKKEWLIFFDALKRVSFRDYLIGKLIIQGVRKLSEVISLKTEDILFSHNQICFRVKKRQNRVCEIKVTYPNFLMEELREYIGLREGLVFVSCRGKQVIKNQIYHYFRLAEHDAQLSIKVTPHVLRASALAYLKQTGFSNEDIMRVSCLSSHEMISAYDSCSVENITSRLPLIF
ncbi:tyrosine-type recombinase/integrase [Chlamydia pecorum]|uniref:Virulence plasmid integrase pGP8-D n=1 Tax=Chlamydia pecorum TaxID=85991 RepID=A0A0N6WZM6_9CHLA|nr:site-specific integrase [Chlamydia pecorum]ALF35206.1 Virulence plasmid integrase pGP8-D [Chlamydia pecorum]ALF35214.1 Virulence plasmid integrase pGP8-D [Chlamydia pecorum]ALF35222.1 Virulence plasmid integrase pGP8-D [Chlamydia pecorum]ALF35230.1 Virulence plasmid integrase pGP8-D [Chlamydia pecorum]ALF35238.1 Virulence plasmid integrase pGP8-D [Chlamydia pecorum]